jgi:RimJ/RimL family protein N-acetyltransferase
MVDIPGYDIRYTDLNDAPYLREWLAAPGVLHWFPMSASQEKEVEDAIQCWIGFSKYRCSLTATIDGTPVGIGTLFLMPYRKVAHHCLFKIVVDPKYQRKGIGSSLLKNLKHLAKTQFRLDLMHIEVFEGNPLISLLKKQDFHEFARQERYVKEDGKYMTRLLMESYLK